jgi:hypothetical protein
MPVQMMNNAQPIFDPATHYRLEVRGQVDVEWLQSFDSSAGIKAEENSPAEEVTVLHIHTDQSGIIGPLRRLHGLGVTIQQVEVISREKE